MSRPHILLLGGHGKIALKMTPLILSRSWRLTSIVRNPDHVPEIQNLATGSTNQANLTVLVESLEDIQTPSAAQGLLDRLKPDWIVWSAGAGGKGGPSRTKAVDEVAAKAFISAALATPTVTKFLMVSYVASRHGRPSWWNDEDWKAAQHVNTEVLPAYFKAKVEADEHLLALTKKRMDGDKDGKFQMINLRPGTLTDELGTGKVSLGKTQSRGKISREDVARCAVALLERNDTRGYFDLLNGDEAIGEAVQRLVKESHDGTEGEDMQRIYAREI